MTRVVNYGTDTVYPCMLQSRSRTSFELHLEPAADRAVMEARSMRKYKTAERALECSVEAAARASAGDDRSDAMSDGGSDADTDGCGKRPAAIAEGPRRHAACFSLRLS